MFQNATISSRPWFIKEVAKHYPIRQFEFNPFIDLDHLAACGTLNGHVLLLDHQRDEILGAVRDIGVLHAKNENVLGICWLKSKPSKFLACTSNGAIRLVDASYAINTRAKEAYSTSHIPDLEVIHSYKKTMSLTCIHTNCEDSIGLSCGNDSSSVRLFDLASGNTVRTFTRAHEEGINIARFSFQTPFLFATSSYDKSIKLWDIRVGKGTSEREIYKIKMESPLVTLAFSPDDQYLLASAVDNDVSSYCVFNGRLHTEIKIEKTGKQTNYTRAYYSDEGKCILSGSSEENIVRLNNSSTGEPLHSISLYDSASTSLLYVQSLRGSQTRSGYYSVLVNSRDPAHPIRMIIIEAVEKTKSNQLTSGESIKEQETSVTLHQSKGLSETTSSLNTSSSSSSSSTTTTTTTTTSSQLETTRQMSSPVRHSVLAQY